MKTIEQLTIPDLEKVLGIKHRMQDLQTQHQGQMELLQQELRKLENGFPAEPAPARPFRGRGRPRKVTPTTVLPGNHKRGRGRPRKNPLPA